MLGHLDYLVADFLPTLQQKAQTGRLVGINDGIEMIVDDKVEFYDEPMMNGQVRRYAKITILMAAFGTFFRTPQIVSIEEEMKALGYEELEVIQQIDASTEYSAALGLDINNPYFNPVLFNAADIVQIKAGVPRYLEVGESIMDAPRDGRTCESMASGCLRALCPRQHRRWHGDS